MNSPTAARPVEARGKGRAMDEQPAARGQAAKDSWVPDSVVSGPVPNSAIPTTPPTTPTTATPPQNAPTDEAGELGDEPASVPG